MKILNYKNRFKAVLAIIFKPSGFHSELKSFESKIRGEEQTKHQNHIRQITNDFEDKFRFAFNEKENAVLSHEPAFHKLHVAQIPLPSVKFERMDNPCFSRHEERSFDVNKLQFGIMDSDAPLDYIKREASVRIASELVNKGFLHSSFDGRNVTFHINII